MISPEKIRKTLYQIDLEILNAKANIRIADSQMNLFKQAKNDYSQSQAIECKMKRECYRAYADDLEGFKRKFLEKLDSILARRYTKKQIEVWKLHFLDKYETITISHKANLDFDDTLEIIKKLEGDLKK